MLNIGIIGGGICGFSCAVKIKEHYRDKAKVTVISDQFTPNTTGDISAGLWGPIYCGDTSERDIVRWSKGMHDFLHELWLTDKAGEAGVCLVPCIRATTDLNGLKPYWDDVVFGFSKFTQQEVDRLNKEQNKDYKEACRFVTFTSEPMKLLPYLTKRFESSGGIVTQRKVSSLAELVKDSQFDVIINCTGLGAKEFVPDDSMHAIRGQVIRVAAPWVYCVLLDDSDDGNYIIPNVDTVVLGGTHQVNDYNTTPDAGDRKLILNGCRQLMPGIVCGREIREMVGLRPGRSSVRLEIEPTANGKLVIHNYGHGGSGVTLAWGCAVDVLDLLVNNTKSKL
ncbi:unnamed protein product [Hermetia illucens]|uniref:FAD dependent oxidoreductase domain-containing protein n=1 Tax=Hermetia illucens TaxID=343691 RepID=A0A7R8UV26_HERIL|nr:D-aspartate oxidase [Hermetia illucens]CAD7087070.1 unnamed protein product [Hermetia illucens]